MTRKNVGIQTRHGRACKTRDLTPEQRRDAALVKRTCNCTPTFRAEVFDRRAGRKIRESFPALSAARAWRHDAIGDVRRGKLRATDGSTVRAAGEAWLEGAEKGTIRTRSGDAYKPSVLRSYRASLEGRVFGEFGAARLASVRRSDVQDFADRLVGEGLDPSTIRNTLMPLRCIYRRAVARGDVAVNPTTGLELPAVRGKRDRIAAPDEAARLLAVLSDGDRALWATAMYAGLRRGELLALRWEDVDLPAGVIRVERAWDVKTGVVDTKSDAGKRRVPIAAVLREHLAAHRLRGGRAEGLAFGRTATTPFNHSSIVRRATAAWKAAKPKPLDPIGLHECRHTFASLMIAAGVNAKALSTYMGHSSITITLDRYGHLMPGNEEEAAVLLDAYLERQAAKATT